MVFIEFIDANLARAVDTSMTVTAPATASAPTAGGDKVE